jgi:hypothetical protein
MIIREPLRFQSAPSFPSWAHLVRATLTTYHDAYGPDGAEHRLRHHLPHWPDPARRALARIAREGGAAWE